MVTLCYIQELRSTFTIQTFLYRVMHNFSEFATAKYSKVLTMEVIMNLHIIWIFVEICIK